MMDLLEVCQLQAPLYAMVDAHAAFPVQSALPLRPTPLLSLLASYPRPLLLKYSLDLPLTSLLQASRLRRHSIAASCTLVDLV